MPPPRLAAALAAAELAWAGVKQAARPLVGVGADGLRQRMWLRRRLELAGEAGWTLRHVCADLGISEPGLHAACDDLSLARYVRPRKQRTDPSVGRNVLPKTKRLRRLPAALQGDPRWGDKAWVQAQVAASKPTSAAELFKFVDPPRPSGATQLTPAQLAALYLRWHNIRLFPKPRAGRDGGWSPDFTARWLEERTNDGLDDHQIGELAEVSAAKVRRARKLLGVPREAAGPRAPSGLTSEQLHAWQVRGFPRWVVAAGLDLADVQAQHAAAFVLDQHRGGANARHLVDRLRPDLVGLTRRQDRQRIDHLLEPLVRALLGRQQRSADPPHAGVAIPLVALEGALVADVGSFAAAHGPLRPALARMVCEALAGEISHPEKLRFDELSSLEDRDIFEDHLSLHEAGAWLSRFRGERVGPRIGPPLDTAARRGVLRSIAREYATTFAARLALDKGLRATEPLRVLREQILGAAEGHHSHLPIRTKTGYRRLAIEHTPNHYLCPACAAVEFASVAVAIGEGAGVLSQLLGPSTYSKALRRRGISLGFHSASFTGTSIRRTAATIVYSMTGSLAQTGEILGHAPGSPATAVYCHGLRRLDLADRDFDLERWQDEVQARAGRISRSRRASLSITRPKKLAQLIADTMDLLAAHGTPTAKRPLPASAHRDRAKLEEWARTKRANPQHPQVVRAWIHDRAASGASVLTLERSLMTLRNLADPPSAADRWLGPAAEQLKVIASNRKREGVVEPSTGQPPMVTHAAALEAAAGTDDPQATLVLAGGISAALRAGSITGLKPDDLTFYKRHARVVVTQATKRGGRRRGVRTYMTSVQYTGDALCISRLKPIARAARRTGVALADIGLPRGLSSNVRPAQRHKRTWEMAQQAVTLLRDQLQFRSMRPMGACIHFGEHRDVLLTMVLLGHSQAASTYIYLTRCAPQLRSAGAFELLSLLDRDLYAAAEPHMAAEAPSALATLAGSVIVPTAHPVGR